MNRTIAFAAVALLAVAPLAAQAIHVDAPNGGETLPLGQGYDIRWTATRVDQNVKIILVHDGGGIAGQIAGELAPGSSPYRWTVGNTLGGAVAAGLYKIRVAAMDGSTKDISDAAFAIVSPDAPPAGGEPILAIQSPRGGESYAEGDPQTISWTAVNLTEDVHVMAARDSQRLKLALRVLDPSIRSFTWETHPFRDAGVETEPAGDYSIILQSGSLTVQSERFRITPLVGHDLVISDPYLEQRSSGKGFRVKVTDLRGDFNGWVVISHYCAGMGLGNAVQERRRLELRRGVAAWVNLANLRGSLFDNQCDVNFVFKVNPDRAVEESNYDNNSVQKKFCWESGHDGRFFSLRMGKNYTNACEACAVVIRPGDVDIVDDRRVRIRLEISLQNCGNTAIRGGDVVINESWNSGRSARSVSMIRDIDIEPGQYRLLFQDVVLERHADNGLHIHFNCGESGGLDANNDFHCHPNFIGF